MGILRRWREGRRARGEAERARSGPGPIDPVALPTSGSISIDAPSAETADELVDILRKHGLAAEVPRPKGKRVEVGDAEDGQLDIVVRAAELWLLLDSTPDEAEIRCGRERIPVRRSAPEGEPTA